MAVPQDGYYKLVLDTNNKTITVTLDSNTGTAALR